VHVAGAALAVLLAALSSGAAAQVMPMDGTLPSSRFSTASVAVDGAVYVFGGQEPGARWSDEVLRYLPGGEVEVLDARLPAGRSQVAAVTDGSVVYLFGGWAGPAGGSDEVLRFDPAAGTVETLGVTLPEPRWSVAAVWDGTGALLLGGDPCAAPCPVLRFDPVAGTIAETGAVLEEERAEAVAVWTGEEALLLGGRVPRGNSTQYYDSVLRYRPGGDVTKAAAALPEPRTAATGFWHDGRAYVLGGSSSAGARLATIVAYDPAADATAAVGPALPEPTSYASSARVDASAYVLGAGYGFVDIIRFTPASAGAEPTPSPSAPETGPATAPTSGPTASGPGPTPDGTTDDGGAGGPPRCDDRPTAVDAGTDPAGDAWVLWQVRLDCLAPAYVVWEDGRRVALVPTAANQNAYRATVRGPGPGEHVFLVQAVEDGATPFDAAAAVPAPPLRIEGAAPTSEVSGDPQGTTTPGALPGDGGTGVWLAALVVVLLAVIGAVALRARRRP